LPPGGNGGDGGDGGGGGNGTNPGGKDGGNDETQKHGYEVLQAAVLSAFVL
jgi:hypothetical protein